MEQFGTLCITTMRPCNPDHYYSGVPGWLEQHWNGSLLDSVETVINFAATLTFKDKHPVVTLVEQVYETGVKLTQQAMVKVEKQLQRLPNLKKWFVEISSKPA